MKKLNTAVFCVTIVLAMMVQPIFAQDNALSFGVKGGINLANITVDPEQPGVSLDVATKFGVGGVLLYPLSDVLDLQVEALFLLKGTKVKFAFGGEVFEGDLDYTYISVPVMGRYNIGSGDISPYAIAGLEFGFLLSAKSKFGDDPEEDEKETTKSIDLGFNIGVGASMNNMFGEIRYSLGLADINDEPDDPDTSLKTTGIQLFVGMMF